MFAALREKKNYIRPIALRKMRVDLEFLNYNYIFVIPGYNQVTYYSNPALHMVHNNTINNHCFSKKL